MRRHTIRRKVSTHILDMSKVALGNIPKMATSSIRQTSIEKSYKNYLERLVEQSVPRDDR